MHIVIAGRPVTAPAAPKSHADAYYTRKSKDESVGLAVWCFIGCVAVVAVSAAAFGVMTILDIVLPALGVL